MNIQNRTLFIGDNLDIMQAIAPETIDLIYLDPPFNTNRDFRGTPGSIAEDASFKDRWSDTDITQDWHELLVQCGTDLYDTIDAIETIHSPGMAKYLTNMAIRLYEMKRILKKTGSIYLHCDQNAGHYLKIVMDKLFGRTNFRDEIIWKRTSSPHKGSQFPPKKWGKNTDSILFYAASKDTPLEPRKPLSLQEKLKKFKLKDKNGERYSVESNHIFNNPNAKPSPNLCYTWRGYTNPYDSGWRLRKERIEEEYQKGNIVIRPDGRLERRKYMKDYEGGSYGNLWTDIKPLTKSERTGYPTQKPIALIRRILMASSEPDDIILDPFSGCGTTVIAAELLNRQWIAIDISESAKRITSTRLEKEIGTIPPIKINIQKGVPQR